MLSFLEEIVIKTDYMAISLLLTISHLSLHKLNMNIIKVALDDCRDKAIEYKSNIDTSILYWFSQSMNFSFSLCSNDSTVLHDSIIQTVLISFAFYDISTISCFLFSMQDCYFISNKSLLNLSNSSFILMLLLIKQTG